jgi:glycosyltransferase involved in cell wall biosynthesis
MQIGFFTNTYFPICYGSVISIESFRKNLEKLGHTVYVFAPSHRGYKDENKKIFRYPSFLFRYKIDYPVSIPISSFINNKIKELDLDIIHVHQPFSLGKEGLRFARKLKIPVIFTYHAKYEDYVHYVPFLPEGLLVDLVKKEAVNFANKCDLTITPSEGIKKIIKRRGVSEKLIKVLPTGIDCQSFENGNRAKIREQYAIKKDEKLFLNIGRINEEKNLKMLFKTVKELILENSKIKMMFVGEGFLKDDLLKMAKKAGISDNVIFTGFIEYEKIKDYLKAADVYLQTSKSETQGITILEAMASEVPIVAVKATGTEDFIVNNKNGFLTKNQSKDFHDKIKFLLKNPLIKNKMIIQAKKDAKKFEEKKQAQKLENIYKKLIG